MRHDAMTLKLTLELPADASAKDVSRFRDACQRAASNQWPGVELQIAFEGILVKNDNTKT